MDLPTYTNIWRIEKRLYKLYDFRLPTPLPVVTLGVFLGVCVVWFALMGLLQVPFSTPWHVIWLVPPLVITWAATRPVIEGKRLTELLLSYGRFLTEARVYTRLAPEREPGEVSVTVRVWHRHPEAGPLPAVRTKAVKKRAKKGAKKGATELSSSPAESAPALDAAPTSGPRELERVREGRRAEAARNAAARGTPMASAAPPLTHVPEPEENKSEPYFEPPPLDRREHTEANGTRHERPEAYERREPDVAPEPEQETREPATPEIVPPAASGTESPRAEPAAPAAATRSEPAPPEPAAPPPAARAGEESPAEHASEPEPDPEHADTRGIGVKVLNYFGFALHRMPGQPEAGKKGKKGSSARSGRANTRRRRPIGEPIPDEFPVREDPEAPHVQRKDTEWFGSLRASSGHTPWPLSSKAAYEAADTGPMAAPDADDTKGIGESAEDRAMARRRAEEMMAAPEPPKAEAATGIRAAPPAQAERAGSPAASVEPRRTGSARAGDSASARDQGPSPQRRLRGRSQSMEISRRRERERPVESASGQAQPADAADGGEQSAPAAGARSEPSERTGSRPVTDGGTSRRRERERPAESASTAPEAETPAAEAEPGAGTRERAVAAPPPERTRARGLGDPATPRETREPDTGRRRGRPHAEPWNLPGLRQDHDGPEAREERNTQARDEHGPEESAAPTPAADTGTGTGPASGSGKPELQLDHGTDEHRSLSHVLGGGTRETTSEPARGDGGEDTRTRDEERDQPTEAREPATGEEPDRPEPEPRGDRMSVLDQHLNKSDTPPPPPPRFAQAGEGSAGGEPAMPRKLSGWFNENDAAEPSAGASTPTARPSKDKPAKKAPRPGQSGQSRAPETPGSGAPDAADHLRPVRPDGHESRDPSGRPPAADTHEQERDPRRSGAAQRDQRHSHQHGGAPADGDAAQKDRPAPDPAEPKDQRSPAPAAEPDSGAGQHDGDRPPENMPAAAQGDPQATTDKPSLELDHGTGEHERFATVQNPPRRSTAADLEAAEAAAFRARQRWAARRAEKGQSTEDTELPESRASGTEESGEDAPRDHRHPEDQPVQKGQHTGSGEPAKPASGTPAQSGAESTEARAERAESGRATEDTPRAAAGSEPEGPSGTGAEPLKPGADSSESGQAASVARSEAAEASDRSAGSGEAPDRQPEVGPEDGAEAGAGSADSDAPISAVRSEPGEPLAGERPEPGATVRAAAEPGGEAAETRRPDEESGAAAIGPAVSGEAPESVEPRTGSAPREPVGVAEPLAESSARQEAGAAEPEQDTSPGAEPGLPVRARKGADLEDRVPSSTVFGTQSSRSAHSPADVSGQSTSADSAEPSAASGAATAGEAPGQHGAGAAPGRQEEASVPGSGPREEASTHGPAAESRPREETTDAARPDTREEAGTAEPAARSELERRSQRLSRSIRANRRRVTSRTDSTAEPVQESPSARSRTARDAEGAHDGAGHRDAPVGTGGTVGEADRGAAEAAAREAATPAPVSSEPAGPKPAESATAAAEEPADPATAAATEELPQPSVDESRERDDVAGRAEAARSEADEDASSEPSEPSGAQGATRASRLAQPSVGDPRERAASGGRSAAEEDASSEGSSPQGVASAPESAQPAAGESRDRRGAAGRARAARSEAAEDASSEASGAQRSTRAPKPGERSGSGVVAPRPDDDGVFNRVAQNARRISQLFGQPAPGEPPQSPQERSSTSAAPSTSPPGSRGSGQEKPRLQLDHGTGEQRPLTETPGNGKPTERRQPGRGKPRQGSGARNDDTSGSNRSTRGWRRLASVVTGGTAAPTFDLPESDIERVRTPIDGPRRVVVLGCTGGAGQSLTTLMLGHTLAAYRDERVVAVDVNPGPGGLSRRIRTETTETVTSLLANADAISGYMAMRNYTSTQSRSGLEVVSTLDDPYVQTLDDRDFTGLTGLLGEYYGLTLLDPAATGVARALPLVDGLVLVAPASTDAARAVAMTFEWLDGHGYARLRSRAIVVINGVSKRSMADVDAAEQVARGRCRAIVRIPWDDHLTAPRGDVDVKALRSTTRRAHGALAGVLARGFRANGAGTSAEANDSSDTTSPASGSRGTREVPR